MDAVALVRDALLDAWALVLPVACAGCGAADRELCAACREALAPRPRTTTTPAGLPVVAGADYDAVARATLLAYKEGRTALAAPLSGLLAAALATAAPLDDVLLCPIPSSRAAMRRRGYDPVATLCARLGVRGVRALAPPHPRAAQKSLDREARQTNVAGAQRARLRLDGRRLLLVDDVVTTGATLDAAAAALRAAGGEVVGAAVVAATPLRVPRLGG